MEQLENNDYPLRRLFDGFVFHIPDYQRFYSWDESHCEDLWKDLINVVNEEGRAHYMGTVICKDEGADIETAEYHSSYRKYGIVDGQQRFTTLVLLVKAIDSAYSAINGDDINGVSSEPQASIPIDDARQRYLIDERVKGLEPGYKLKNKLKLQSDDNGVFKDILRGDQDHSRADTPSQDRLLLAYEYFTQRLTELRDSTSPNSFLDTLGQLISAINSLQFMVYTIDSQEEATLIFESVNDRGKGLSNLDKTKSFLMHKVYLTNGDDASSPLAIEHVQERFGDIYRAMQTVEDRDRTSDIEEDQIQRFHYIAKVPREVNKEYLKRNTDRQRTLRRGAPVYLDALKWHFNELYDDSADEPHASHNRSCVEEIEWYTDSLRRYYAHFEDFATYGSQDTHDDIDWELTKLFSLGRLGNFYPLMLEVWEGFNKHLSAQDVHRILQTIEVASFRIYTVANKRSDTGESKFYKLANRLDHQSIAPDDIIAELNEAVQRYEDDFEDALSDHHVYSTFARRDLRYLLYSFELHVRDQDMGGAAPSMERAVHNAAQEYSIDHIWPQNTSKLSLTDREEEIHERKKHSLGNLTLTTGPKNASWKHLPYRKKRKRPEGKDYDSSDFASTRKIARDYDSWGESQIDERLKEIVAFAKRRWSLDPEERDYLASLRPS